MTTPSVASLSASLIPPVASATSVWHPARLVAGALYVSSLTLLLLLLLARTPLAISETIAVFESIETLSWWTLLRGNEQYVRPLFWFVVPAIWKLSPSVDAALLLYRLLHLAAFAWLIGQFVRVLAPRDAAAWLAVPTALAALVGASSFRENLEAFPINPTLFVVGCGLTAYALIEQPYRRFNDGLAIVLSLLAIGAKEQGIAVPILIAAGVFAGARGIRRSTALTLLIITAAYCVIRLIVALDSTPFPQSLGVGFREWDASELARFSDTRWLLYLYNVGATALHVVLGEPSRGMFVWTRSLLSGDIAPWQVVYGLSGMCAAAAVLVWSVRAFRSSASVDCEPSAVGVLRGTSNSAGDSRGTIADSARDRRLIVVFLATWAVTSALAFSYTRDRMAVVAVAFFAVLVHRAIAAAIRWIDQAGGWRMATALGAIAVIALSWQLRSAATLFYVHDVAWENRKEWLLDIAERRRWAAERPAYAHLLEVLRAQGTDATVPGSSPPRFIVRWIDYRW